MWYGREASAVPYLAVFATLGAALAGWWLYLLVVQLVGASTWAWWYTAGVALAVPLLTRVVSSWIVRDDGP